MMTFPGLGRVPFSRTIGALIRPGCAVLLICGSGCARGAAGPWARHTIDDSSRGADGVHVADVNGDGWMDLAVGWEEGGISRAYLNPGPGSVTERWPAVTVGQVGDVEDAVFVDLDGDGAIDVISSAEGGTRGLFVHWAPADPSDYLNPDQWETAKLPASAGRMWMFAVPMQVDGRHGVDLVAGGKGDGAVVAWLESPADEPRDLDRWRLHEMSPVGWTMSLLAQDLDADGDLDVVVTDRRPNGGLQGARWLENPGTGRPEQQGPWRNHFIGARGREVMLTEPADLDGDGRDDLVVPIMLPDEIAFLRQSAPVTGDWESYPIPYPELAGAAKAINVADIDLDGDPDIVLSSEHAGQDRSGVLWMSYHDGPTGNGWTVHDISGPEGIKFDVIPLLDLDADGDLDVISTEERTGGAGLGVIWYENPTRRAR